MGIYLGPGKNYKSYKVILDGSSKVKEYGHISFHDDMGTLALSMTQHVPAESLPDKYRSLTDLYGRKQRPFSAFLPAKKWAYPPALLALSAYVHPSDNQRYSIVLLSLKRATANGEQDAWTYTRHWLEAASHHYALLYNFIKQQEGYVNTLFPVNEMEKTYFG